METPIQDLENKQYHNIETPQWNVVGYESSNKKCPTGLLILKEHSQDNDNIFSQNYFKVNEIKIDCCKNNDNQNENNQKKIKNTNSYRKIDENKENLINNIRVDYNNEIFNAESKEFGSTTKQSNTYSNYNDNQTPKGNKLHEKEQSKVKVNASVKKVFEKSKKENTLKSSKSRYNSKEPVQKMKEIPVSNCNKKKMKNPTISKDHKKAETLQPRTSFRNSSKDTHCLRQSTRSPNKAERVSIQSKKIVDRKSISNKTPEPRKDPKRLTLNKDEKKYMPPTTTIHYGDKSKYIGTTLKNGSFNEKHGVGVMFYADFTK